ncbi:hypothetical protein CXB51_017512 [Gossypium anomalum]|uniref:Reverse transcriptase Ty1/copia-type domain-containing protein n=1 Tax=Gossypium anomalum TaxID=47600 RepID=A0A8J5Z6N1_9ROSI|nr:hypothetical protein CXB51_017512 [Gossypium anomalum]
MGYNALCKITGVGTIKVKIFDGVVRTLSDVRHVLELKRNLISLSTLDSKGYKYTAESRILKISKAIASSSLSNNDITKLWHMHLGHMSENGMAELSKRGLLDGVPSRGGANYILTFIDDFSRKVWAFFLKQKSDVFSNDHREGSMYVSNANLPKSFWAETASTVFFLINRSPSIAIEKKTLQEVWSGNPTDYSDLKIFGCPVYAHVDNGKLEPRSIKYVFFGYKAGVKGIRREIKPLKKYAEASLVAYALNVGEDIDANQELSNYSEAVSCEDSEKWMFAMQEEMESLHKNRTQDLVKLPKGKKVVRCKWVFKKKEGTLGVEELRYKTRLVAKGYSQILGVDFTDVFSPVVKHSSIRALLGIMALHDLQLEQLGVKTTFFHEKLEKDIYMQQPESFTILEKEDYVCLLKKSLYDLKQSPTQWYKRFDSFVTSHDFKRSNFDSCVYIKKNSDNSFVYLLLYVDDMLIVAKDKCVIRKVKAQLSEEIDKKDLGPAKKILCMEILRDRKANDEIEYMSHIPYSSAVGSLMHAIVCSRSDLSYVVNAFQRTRDEVIGYVDADFARDLDRRRSVTGYVFTIGGCTIS